MLTQEKLPLLHSILLALIDILRPSLFDQSQLALGFRRRCGVGWIFSFQLTLARSVVTYFTHYLYLLLFLRESVCVLSSA